MNEVFTDIEEDESSAVWVREAMANKHINSDAVKEIVQKRYGDKVVVANPFDPNSVDEAIAAGYKVITGSELSKEEWANLKEYDTIRSSSEVFSRKTITSTPVEPDKNMLEVAELAKKIAKRCMGIIIKVSFAKWDGVSAQYGDRTLSFNVKALGKSFFDPSLSRNAIDLIVHEIGHEKGQHTETSYHEALTEMTGKLVMIALDDPKFFNRK